MSRPTLELSRAQTVFRRDLATSTAEDCARYPMLYDSLAYLGALLQSSIGAECKHLRLLSYGFGRMRKKKPKPIALINENQILRQDEGQRAAAKQMIESAREMRNEALQMHKTLSTTNKKRLP
jgi:hypothetical protein